MAKDDTGRQPDETLETHHERIDPLNQSRKRKIPLRNLQGKGSHKQQCTYHITV